jgi:hypothetical protein
VPADAPRVGDYFDQIDEALAAHYGFTQEEAEFIINYDIKYRLGPEAEDIDSESVTLGRNRIALAAARLFSSCSSSPSRCRSQLIVSGPVIYPLSVAILVASDHSPKTSKRLISLFTWPDAAPGSRAN